MSVASRIAVSLLVGLVASAIGAASAAGLSLAADGIVFSDGTVQTTAATNEVAGYFQANAAVVVTSGQSESSAPLADVPDGYIALIEFMSATCSTTESNPIVEAGVTTTKRTSL